MNTPASTLSTQPPAVLFHRRVYLINLSPNATPVRLCQALWKAGHFYFNLGDINMPINPRTKQNYGACFVDFYTETAARRVGERKFTAKFTAKFWDGGKAIATFDAPEWIPELSQAGALPNGGNTATGKHSHITSEQGEGKGEQDNLAAQVEDNKLDSNTSRTL